jgi:hypothetical protein
MLLPPLLAGSVMGFLTSARFSSFSIPHVTLFALLLMFAIAGGTLGIIAAYRPGLEHWIGVLGIVLNLLFFLLEAIAVLLNLYGGSFSVG